MAVTFVNQEKNYDVGTSTTITAPPGGAGGDVLIFSLFCNDNPGEIAVPSGFEYLTQQSNDGTGGIHMIFFKINTGNEPSSYSTTWDNTSSFISVVMAFRGADVSAGTPIENYGGVSGEYDNSTYLGVYFDTYTAGTMVVAIAVADLKSSGTGIDALYDAQSIVTMTSPAQFGGPIESELPIMRTGYGICSASPATEPSVLSLDDPNSGNMVVLNILSESSTFTPITIVNISTS